MTEDFLARIEQAKFDNDYSFLNGMREMLEQIEKDVKEVWLEEPEKLVEKLQTYAEALK